MGFTPQNRMCSTPLRIAALAMLLCVVPGLRALAQESAPAAQPPAADPSTAAGPPAELARFEQQASYAMGVNIGRNLRADGVPLDVPSLTAGITDALAGGELKLSDQQLVRALQVLQQEMMRRAQQAAVVNKQEGVTFLTANAKQPGVQTTASGLQYKVIKKGAGATPKATDQVRAHYEGRLIDGTVFDSSYKRGEPSLFPVGRVIAGWTEALQMMKVGGKWELYVPSDIAYGIEGRPPKIGPNKTLLFTVELVEVVQ